MHICTYFLHDKMQMNFLCMSPTDDVECSIKTPTQIGVSPQQKNAGGRSALDVAMKLRDNNKKLYSAAINSLIQEERNGRAGSPFGAGF